MMLMYSRRKKIGGQLIAVGDGYGVIRTSPDGVTWTSRATGFTSVTGITSLVYLNNLFIAGNSAGEIATSTNGITWTKRYTAGNGINSIVWTGSAWFAAADTSTNNIIKSTNGTTWTPVASNIACARLAWGNGVLMATNRNDKVSTSSTGVTWTTHVGKITDMIYVGSKWVACVDNLVKQSTNNGATWTTLGQIADGPGNTTSGSFITYTNGKYFITGMWQWAYYSTDGVTWAAANILPYSTGCQGTMIFFKNKYYLPGVSYVYQTNTVFGELQTVAPGIGNYYTVGCTNT